MDLEQSAATGNSEERISTPEIAGETIIPIKGELLPLSRSVTKVWTIKSALAAGFVTLAALVFDVVEIFSGGISFAPFGLITGVVLIVGLLLAYVVPRLRYKYWRYRLHDEELFVQRGIFNRVHTIVPLRRIQHLDVSQDIIEREFELGKLIVHTAGTRSSDVIVPGLEIGEANRLRDQMKNYILEDAV